jgi:hypothetical protein
MSESKRSRDKHQEMADGVSGKLFRRLLPKREPIGVTAMGCASYHAVVTLFRLVIIDRTSSGEEHNEEGKGSLSVAKYLQIRNKYTKQCRFF